MDGMETLVHVAASLQFLSSPTSYKQKRFSGGPVKRFFHSTVWIKADDDAVNVLPYGGSQTSCVCFTRLFQYDRAFEEMLEWNGKY